MMKKIYKNDISMLDSFNELTRNTFDFDFVQWHASDCEKLYLYQIIGKEKVDIKRVAKAFGGGY